MSDSSSEDEIPDHLCQSVDKHFMNDSLFSSNNTHVLNNDNKKESTLPPSLRPTSDENNYFTLNGLTKSNQKFIADRLSKFLDDKLDKTIVAKCSKVNSHCDVSGGVLLFSDSVELLGDEKIDTSISKRKRKHKVEIPDEELEKRCKEVSVSSKWITSGAATKGWTKSSKGEVVRVKKLKQSNSGAVDCELIK